MSQFKVVFLGTPEFAVPCLEKLIEDPHFDVVGVVTQPDRPSGRNLKVQASPVKQHAQKNNIPVMTPENLQRPEALNQLKSWQPESAVVVAFGQILNQAFLDFFNGRVVNIHGSLLPRWRGAAPIQRAIMAGDKETGVSLQVVVKKLDAGPLLGVRKCPIEDDLLATDLYLRLQKLGPDLLATEYADWLRGHLPPEEQNENLVTLAPKIRKEEGLVDWNKSAVNIYNEFRGLYGWPGSWVIKNGKQIKIKKCRMVAEDAKRPPGEITHIHDEVLRVACQKGQIEILNVQPESKSAMPIGEYLRGHSLKVGEKL